MIVVTKTWRICI